MLKIPLDFSLYVGYKQCEFYKTLPKTNLTFFPSGRDRTITFNLSFVLLSAEVNLILEEQSHKRDAFEA